MPPGSFNPWEYAFACYLALNEPSEVFRKVGNGNFGYLGGGPRDTRGEWRDGRVAGLTSRRLPDTFSLPVVALHPVLPPCLRSLAPAPAPPSRAPAAGTPRWGCGVTARAGLLSLRGYRSRGSMMCLLLLSVLSSTPALPSGCAPVPPSG